MSRDEELERLARIGFECGLDLHRKLAPDLLVEGRLLIELKSAEAKAKVHAKQLITYLRLMKLPLGLLMNFGLDRFSDGFQRLGNGYFAPPR